MRKIIDLFKLVWIFFFGTKVEQQEAGMVLPERKQKEEALVTMHSPLPSLQPDQVVFKGGQQPIYFPPGKKRKGWERELSGRRRSKHYFNCTK